MLILCDILHYFCGKPAIALGYRHEALGEQIPFLQGCFQIAGKVGKVQFPQYAGDKLFVIVLCAEQIA